MKKIFLITVCFICSAVLFAEDINPISFGHDPFARNSDIKLSPYSDLESRADINSMPAFILNLLLGFGIGSYVQGDNVGGTICLISDISGIGLGVGGIVYTLKSNPSGIWLTVSGVSLFFVSRIFSMIRPFTYANKVALAFAPGINDKGKPEFASYVSFKY